MEPKAHAEELLDIVNEQDEPTRIMPEREMRQIGHAALAKNGEYVRAVCAFIKNNRGQLWIPRRCETKKVLPGTLDMGISGLVSAGETYDQALAREAMEEANIDVSTMSVNYLGLLPPWADADRNDVSHAAKREVGGHAKAGFFTAVYEIASDDTPDYNCGDFCDSYWLYPQELLDMLPNEKPVKGGLAVAIKIFYL